MPDLAIIVPTRGRPDNIRKVIEAWDFTNAWDHADLILAVDGDDPEFTGYMDLKVGRTSIRVEPDWMPMVHKLNAAAVSVASAYPYFALGFAGDDHLPQTIGWAQRYLTVLRELGTGMVYGDDGYQGKKLSTEWAVTSDVVRALGRMVPADVEHMYCDNAMMDLFGAAGALRHLPEVRIEHMHPYAGKAKTDAQYQRVNHRDQFNKDRRAYEGWLHGDVFQKDVAEIRHLRRGRTDVPTPKPSREVSHKNRRVSGSEAARKMRSGPSSVRRQRSAAGSALPRMFQHVQGATPDEIGLTLADFATQVPADQEIVELGVFRGRTALLMAWGARQGFGAHVTGIDPWNLTGNVYDPPFTDDNGQDIARRNVKAAGYDPDIRLINGFSHEVAAEWYPKHQPVMGQPKKSVGLLFVDGDHTREGAKRDIVSWAPHLAPGAIIAVDDYGHPDWPGVGEAVDELVAEGVLEPIEIFHQRLAVTRLSAASEIDRELSKPDKVSAITSEGVSPSPEPMYPPDADGFTDGSRGGSPHESSDPDQVDTAVSKRRIVTAEESQEVRGIDLPTKIEDLNTFQLRALAKRRGIRLGTRKDKRDSMLQALADGE